MDLDKLAIKNSAWTWNKLRDARKYGSPFSEETITESIILEFTKYGAGKLTVKTFTKRKESFNGSDWEWWFTGPSHRWLGMRVQAKVLNLNSEKYEHLHYKNQLETLISDANKNDLIPLYCMYSNWNIKKYKAAIRCQSYKHTVRHYGNAILNPYKVEKLKQQGRTELSSVIEDLHPMHCIFCCTGYGGSDLPGRALKYLKGKEFLQFPENPEEDSTSQFIKQSPPSYVLRLMSGGHEDTSIEVEDDRPKRVTVFKELGNE